jgi:hypothetical protein
MTALTLIRDELAQIAERTLLTPAEVVDAARDPRSALHGQFVWDDSDAAEMFRLQQARALIKRVRVEVVRSDQEVVIVPAFIRAPEGGGYTATQTIAVNTLDRETVVLRALAQVATILRNLAAPEVDELLTQVIQLRGRMEQARAA